MHENINTSIKYITLIQAFFITVLTVVVYTVKAKSVSKTNLRQSTVIPENLQKIRQSKDKSNKPNPDSSKS